MILVQTKYSTSLKHIFTFLNHHVGQSLKFSAFEFGMCMLMCNSDVHCAIHKSIEMDRENKKALWSDT